MKASVVGVCLVFGLFVVSCYDDSPSSGQVFVCDPAGDDCGDSGVCVQAGMLWVCSSDRKCSPACRSPEVCVNGDCECFPSCTGLECGDDSCGGSCGKCPAGESWSCIAGKCKDDCEGLECGESPRLGVDCGKCPAGESWSCIAGKCVDDCEGLECGESPKLGVVCATCSGQREWCDNGKCVDDCGDAECGISPNGLLCGECQDSPNWWCDAGTCKDDCITLECGVSPILGISCGTCPTPQWCWDGICEEEDCSAVECGAGPHGVLCGTCSIGEVCDGFHECVDMVHVPAGSFWMGCHEELDGDCAANERPCHEIGLSGFYVDVSEVRNSAYAACVTAGICSEPSSGEDCNWKKSGRDAHPVNCVTWDQAVTYCSWLGKRLPTEAEWEKAARGEDGRKYPWGNDEAGCDCAVMKVDEAGCGEEMTSEVCSRSPVGDSPYGLCDMAGNVWEWVADWYGADYYSASPLQDPQGPDSGSDHVRRGGGFTDIGERLRSSYRSYFYHPAFGYSNLGFRCARSE